MQACMNHQGQKLDSPVRINSEVSYAGMHESPVSFFRIIYNAYSREGLLRHRSTDNSKTFEESGFPGSCLGG